MAEPRTEAAAWVITPMTRQKEQCCGHDNYQACDCRGLLQHGLFSPCELVGGS